MTSQATVLIVDDEKHTREGLRLSLEEEFDVYVAGSTTEALEILKGDPMDVMLTDLRLGGESGMDLIEKALKLPHPPICIMMTAYGSVDTAVEAMKRGAYDFVTKPLNLDEVEILIKRALKSRTLERENVELKKQVERKYSIEGILGQSEVMKPVFEIIEQVAPTRATVLIEGESGTGKELVARALHHLSGRPKAKLVTVHCAALAPNVLESELFGHEKGSFTGAMDRRIGRFELADGGTLFLDEIGEIDANVQVKLLRALGEQTIERVGGSKPIKVDVRVIAATNKDLAALVQEGKFREDLFWRLRVVQIDLPPLRARKGDIPILAESFLKELAALNGKPYKPLSEDALQALLAYDWPGNVRELRTALEHGVVMCNTPRVGLRHLPQYILSGGSILPGASSGKGVDANTVGGGATGSGVFRPGDDLNLEKMERAMIEAALQRTGDNRTEAAELLGLSRRTLQRKLQEMGRVKRIRRRGATEESSEDSSDD
ncbi:DNA-binding NtrC family response regulator [Roseimicrobium gellanilyticum]|uniref:DNA-binding NtrC family response regulator n=1 Tax=Roseimicrobium gellanilyticum TaxID=748857 RepID=A0A366HLE9_9BACT|nr:sigma-54 dependent transcriptional regulator [Roseimicrobium gellanilyticum]RBP43753.1 DNA-binding NtrC family response regulator [Roseimicrobium gellanilyticum]